MGSVSAVNGVRRRTRGIVALGLVLLLFSLYLQTHLPTSTTRTSTTTKRPTTTTKRPTTTTKRPTTTPKRPTTTTKRPTTTRPTRDTTKKSLATRSNRTTERPKISTNVDATRVLVLSTNPRSGSSFFSDILTPMDRHSFLFFEPLRAFYRKRGNDEHSMVSAKEKIDVLHSLLHCRLEKESKVMQWPARTLIFKKPKLQMPRGLATKGLSKGDREARLIEAARRQCGRSTLRVAKTIRLSLEEVFTGNLFDMDDDVRVLLLIRDPRAVAASIDRIRNAWPPMFRDTKVICKKTLDNLKALEKAPTDKVMLVRYEDVLTNSRATVENITKFLNRPDLVNPILRNIHQHLTLSQGEKATYYSTFRDADTFKHDKWRKGMRSQLSRDLSNDTACQESIHRLHYQP